MSWEGSRKRRRSPPPGERGSYDDEYKPLIFKEVELVIPAEEEQVKKDQESATAETAMEAEDAAETSEQPAEDVKEEKVAEEKEEVAEEKEEVAEEKEEVAEEKEEVAEEKEEVAEEKEEVAEEKEEVVEEEEKGEKMDDGDADGKTESAVSEEKMETSESSEAKTEDAGSSEKESKSQDGDNAKKSRADEKSSPEKKRPKKPPVAQLYFNRLHSPYVVCRLNHDQQQQLKFFSAPRKVCASFVRCLLDESQVLLTRAQELQEQMRLDQKFSVVGDVQLEFITGRRQSSRSSHNHIALPVHAYYLLRLYYYKEIRTQKTVDSEVKANLPSEQWLRYVENRRRYLDDQASRARHYHREDEELAHRYVRNYERAKDSQRRKREEKAAAEAKAKAEAEAKAKAEKEAEEKAKQEEAAEKAKEEEATEKDKEEEAATEGGEESQGEENTEKSENGPEDDATAAGSADDAVEKSDESKTEAGDNGCAEEEEADNSAGAEEEPAKSSENSSSSSSKQSEELEAEDINFVTEGENHIARSYIPLGQVVRSTVNGYQLDVTFDPKDKGLPVISLVVNGFPALHDASVDQLEQLVSLLNEWCDCLHFTSICTVVLQPGSNEVRIVTDIASFLQRINTPSVPVWAKRWKENREHRSSTSSRAVGESVESLQSHQPGAMHVSEWSEY